MSSRSYQVIVIGGGHAGVEAAWAAANLLPRTDDERSSATVALVTLDPGKIGVMSCNPAIGGLAKGQIVREIDALGGIMGMAADASGVQFKVLNTSKGAAVHGPRAQCDKHVYAESVRRLIASRREIEIVAGSVEQLIVEGGRVRGVLVKAVGGPRAEDEGARFVLSASSVVLTTGTFMRGLMHTGEQKTPGGRFGEGSAVGISGALAALGFELGRLKTGTPPRLKKSTIRWDELPPAPGDVRPVPFSELTDRGSGIADRGSENRSIRDASSLSCFPVLPQIECRVTSTNSAIHGLIRDNIHRAPMYSGQIESVGPRYCPSIEDKVVRFADRESHHVFLEPESLRPGHDEWVYCNGISTSLPSDVQDGIVRGMPGCERAEVLRYGYAVEYDMVRPHQIAATGMTKLVDGLFLAGQINGTSGYEEAAAQGIVAGINAARLALGLGPITFGRDEAYIGVLMDDLVTKTPTEPYRMFTSRAEHRLLLRADNAPDRLTARARELGLLGSTELGRLRRALFDERTGQLAEINRLLDSVRIEGMPLGAMVRRPEYSAERLGADLARAAPDTAFDRSAVFTAHTDRFYATYIERQRAEVRRHGELERRRIPPTLDYAMLPSVRSEARHALSRFRPETLGQAARLEGITPADITLLSVFVKRENERRRVDAV